MTMQMGRFVVWKGSKHWHLASTGKLHYGARLTELPPSVANCRVRNISCWRNAAKINAISWSRCGFWPLVTLWSFSMSKLRLQHDEFGLEFRHETHAGIEPRSGVRA